MYCRLCLQYPHTPRPYNKRCIVHCVYSAHTHPGPTTSDVLYIVSTVPTHTPALQQVMYCTLCPQCPHTPRPYNKWCIVHCVYSTHPHPGPTTSDVLYIVSTVPTHTQTLQQVMYCTLCPQCPPTPRPYNKWCIVHCVHSAHPHPGPTTSDAAEEGAIWTPRQSVSQRHTTPELLCRCWLRWKWDTWWHIVGVTVGRLCSGRSLPWAGESSPRGGATVSGRGGDWAECPPWDDGGSRDQRIHGKGLRKVKKIKKSKITMEVGWWVKVSLEKKLENRPNIVVF